MKMPASRTLVRTARQRIQENDEVAMAIGIKDTIASGLPCAFPTQICVIVLQTSVHGRGPPRRKVPLMHKVLLQTASSDLDCGWGVRKMGNSSSQSLTVLSLRQIMLLLEVQE